MRRRCLLNWMETTGTVASFWVVAVVGTDDSGVALVTAMDGGESDGGDGGDNFLRGVY